MGILFNVDQGFWKSTWSRWLSTATQAQKKLTVPVMTMLLAIIAFAHTENAHAVQMGPAYNCITSTTYDANGNYVGARVDCTLLEWTNSGEYSPRGGSWTDTGGGSFVPNPGIVMPTGDPSITCPIKGNPIVFSTGNKIEPELDFATNGEMPLLLARTYNHFSTETGLFGRHWTSNFDLKVVKSADNLEILAYRPDGRKIRFVWNAAQSVWLEDKASPVARIQSDGAGGYTLYGEDNAVETYNSAGKITSQKNQRGIGLTFSYSGGYLQTVTHTSGRSIQFGWTNGALTSVTDPAGNVFTYTYALNQFGTGIHRLSSATQPGTTPTQITYHYELGTDAGALTGKSFNGVRYSTFAYSGSRAIRSEHVGGADKNTFAYTDGANGALTVLHTNPLGKQTTYQFINGKIQSVAGHASTYCASGYKETTYDANGYPDLVSDFAGNMTNFDYNAKGQLLQRTEAAGTPLARVTQYQWDATNNRVSRETIVGLRKTDYVYFSNGRPQSVTVTNLSDKGVPNQTRTTTYAYTTHPNGMLATVTVDGPVAGTADALVSMYDTQGNLTSTRNSLGHTVSYSSYNALGLPGRVTDVNGAVADYTYDPRGRLLSETNWVSGVARTTTTAYDGRGRVNKVTTPDYEWRDFTWDDNNRLTESTSFS